MGVTRNILMRAFGCPQGMLGRLGGIIMALTNAEFGAWVSDLLKVRPSESVLEVGFGPGTVIHHLTAVAAAGKSRALIRRRRWFNKPVRATQPQSRAVALTCGSVR